MLEPIEVSGLWFNPIRHEINWDARGGTMEVRKYQCIWPHGVFTLDFTTNEGWALALDGYRGLFPRRAPSGCWGQTPEEGLGLGLEALRDTYQGELLLRRKDPDRLLATRFRVLVDLRGGGRPGVTI